MRPFIAILLAALIIGGVRTYISVSTRWKTESTTVIDVVAEGDFEVELLLTFDAGPDAFSLDEDDAASVVLSLAGKELVRRTDLVKAGQAITVAATGVVEGENEFLLTSHPAEDSPDAIRAARVRVLKDDDLLVERWIASEPGMTAEGTIRVDVPEAAGHDH